jgi:anti-sigma factor RsiW
MEAHIDFADLTIFVWMDALTPETKELALRVNQHLVGCPECRQRVEELQRLRQEAEELRKSRRTLAQEEQKDMGKVLPFRRQVETVHIAAAEPHREVVAEEGTILLDEEK